MLPATQSYSHKRWPSSPTTQRSKIEERWGAGTRVRQKTRPGENCRGRSWELPWSEAWVKVPKIETAVVFYNLFLKRVYVLVCLITISKYYLIIIAVVQSDKASLSFTNSWSLLKLMSIKSVMPYNHFILCCPLLLTTISSSVAPFSSCPQSFPASGSFPISQHFTSDGQLLELQHQSFQWIFRVHFLQDWLVWSPCCPRDSQESSPAPQFEASIL